MSLLNGINHCFWETYRHTSAVINGRISLNQQDLFFVFGIACIGSKIQHVVVKKNSQKVPFWHRDNFFYKFCFFFFQHLCLQTYVWIQRWPLDLLLLFFKNYECPKTPLFDSLFHRCVPARLRVFFLILGQLVKGLIRFVTALVLVIS